ncbi:MAG: hypothetical protein R2754_00230 [Microthrixaceae bacterium]
MIVHALGPHDDRTFSARVAGAAALVVAKAHKIGERAHSSPGRLVDKDAHDVYRILVGTEMAVLAQGFDRLFEDDLSRSPTEEATAFIRDLFAVGPDAAGSMMAGRTEAGIGEPETVARQVSILASDLLASIRT